MLSPSTKALLVLASLAISFALISEAISVVPKIPITDFGFFSFPGRGGVGSNAPTKPADGSNTTIGPPVDCFCPGLDDQTLSNDTKLFQIIGYTNTTYIRTQTAEIYNSSWSSLWEEGKFYSGGIIKLPWINGYSGVVSFIVNPLVKMVGFTACTLDTYSIGMGHLLIYNPYSRTWYGYEAVSASYRVEAHVNTQDRYSLRYDSYEYQAELLQLPKDLKDKLSALALEATKDKWSTDDQLESIEAYLKSHYTYDPGYTRPPEGVDPIDWFLFTEKRGTCGSFNSAFVLLARSLGIPARLVVGYAVDPQAEDQFVTAGQAHAWAEVPYKNAGWFTYDATPGYAGSNNELDWSNRTSTVTRVTAQANVTVKGQSFQVNGTVNDDSGKSVDGIRVNIYIKPWKGAPGILCGSGLTKDGQFSVNCTVPKALPVGDYLTEAHSLGDYRYLGSSSDPPIRVLAETTLSLDLPKKIVFGSNLLVNARLIESETEEGIMWAECIVSYTNGTWKTTDIIRTNFEGSIFSQFNPPSPGNWTVTIESPGFGDWLGTNASTTVRVLNLDITLKPLPIIIRGEPTLIEGRVHAEDIPGSNVIVYITGGGLDDTATTDKDGTFRIPYPTTTDTTLGQVRFEVKLRPDRGSIVTFFGGVSDISYNTISIDPISNNTRPSQNSAVLSSRICARTSLRVLEQSSSQWHLPFNLKAILIDDHNAPVDKGNITLTTNSGLKLQSLTSDNGSARITGLLANQPSNNVLSYNLTFSGRDYLLGSHTEGQVQFMTEYGLEGLLPYAVPVIAACCAVYYGVVRKKPGSLEEESIPQLTSIMAKQKPMERPKTGLIKVDGFGETIEVELPQIVAPLPFTWGIEEPLDFKVKVSDSQREALRNEVIKVTGIKGVETLSLDEKGEVSGTLNFSEKGHHRLTFRHDRAPRWSEASLAFSIVDYSEEIIQLFNVEFKVIEGRLRGREGFHTAREVLDMYTKTCPVGDTESLRIMFNVFEEASYSSHRVGRGQFERFYAARVKCFGGR